MAITDYKITSGEVNSNHVKNAPNVLTGTAQTNKNYFDKLPELIVTKHNNLIDAIGTDKQDTLVSGTNIKTVNSTSLLGSGNVSVQPTLVSGTNIKTVNNTSLLGSGNVAVQPTLVSGTNIKTVNSTSLLGSGNVAVQETLVSGTNIKTVNSTSLLGSGNVAVQETLVSGTNIKTVNNNSLLGSGNITIRGDVIDVKTHTSSGDKSIVNNRIATLPLANDAKAGVVMISRDESDRYLDIINDNGNDTWYDEDGVSNYGVALVAKNPSQGYEYGTIYPELLPTPYRMYTYTATSDFNASHLGTIVEYTIDITGETYTPEQVASCRFYATRTAGGLTTIIPLQPLEMSISTSQNSVYYAMQGFDEWAIAVGDTLVAMTGIDAEGEWSAV